MKPEDFKYIVSNRSRRARLLFSFTQNFLSKQADVDDTDDMAVLVNHREGEKFVEDEKLAGIENRGGRRNGNDTADHDVAQRAVERCG